jgi:2'-5' RNA ligase
MVRRQLTLFVPAPYAAAIEAVRQVVDPVQHRLIAAHVTLCREDELAPLAHDELDARAGRSLAEPLVLAFGAPEPFDGHGILLPCVAGLGGFHALRRRVLGVPSPRAHRPHLTLAHPRNPVAPGNALDRAAALADLGPIPFDAVSLIEQHGHEPWRVLRTWVAR